jgi:hypothetical protein
MGCLPRFSIDGALRTRMSYRWNDIDAFSLRQRTVNDAIPAMLERPFDGTLPLQYARIGASGEG